MAGPHRRPQPDIYTVMLAISLVAVVIGLIFLYLETADYEGNQFKGAPPVMSVLSLATPNAQRPISTDTVASPALKHYTGPPQVW